MASIPGGSAYAFAREIAEGYQLVTERTFKGFTRAQLDQVMFEIERALRDIRGDNDPTAELLEVQARNRRIQRLNGALTIVRNVKQRVR